MTSRLLIFLVSVGLVALGCRETKPPAVSTGPSAADSADEVFFGFSFKLTSGGIRRGEVFGDTAYAYDNETRFDLRKARIEFMQDNGERSGTARGERGQYNLRTQELEAWGNVVVSMADGRMLKTPHLVYKQLLNEVSSDTTYELSQGERVQHGGAFKTDPKFTVFSCLKRCGGSGPVAIPNP
jgi:LPS export ABC transporter protein LptC